MNNSTTATTIRFRPSIRNGSGGRKGWCKHVTSVPHNARNSKEMAGEYLRDGVQYDLPHGAVLLFVQPVGSAKNGYMAAEVFRLVVSAEDNNAPYLETCMEETVDWRSDFLDVRDALTRALETPIAVGTKDSTLSDAEVLARVLAQVPGDAVATAVRDSGLTRQTSFGYDFVEVSAIINRNTTL